MMYCIQMIDEPYRPRARLFDATGEVEDVSDKMSGAQEYFNTWKNELDTPQRQQVSAWQQVDEKHAANTGSPAYRVVYKTLKIIPFPSVELKWPNLKIHFYCGDVERGGIKFEGSIPGRREDQSIIPESGRIYDYGQVRPTYIRCPNLNFHAAAWEETVKAVSAVEIIWISDNAYQEARHLHLQ